MNKVRCPWVGKEEIYIHYHDTEWGKPLHDDQKLFEAIILDSFQAGLSWITILKKRETFRTAFDNFNAEKMAVYDALKIESLMNNTGIIRNRLKIEAAIGNAKSYLEIKEEFGSFDTYIWQFTNNTTLINKPASLANYPSRSIESDRMSKDMKKRGFKFCGTTICYAFMQAVGMVNDHSTDCWLCPK